MKLREIREIYHRELDDLYPREEVNSFFYLLLEEFFGLNRFALVLDPERGVSKTEEQPLFEALARLRREYPIQYILGKTEFMDMEFQVDEGVLIPRPETEELVRWVLEERKGREKGVSVLDIGTGSGCIAVSLAANWPQARVTALDISRAALVIAQKNAKANGTAVTFIRADILKESQFDEKWDIIVSNPPYVRVSEKSGMPNNVRLYEPASALFVPDESPLLYFERIIRLAEGNLKSGGSLYFEISEFLGTEVRMLLENAKFSEITPRKDSYGKDRFLKGTKPS